MHGFADLGDGLGQPTSRLQSSRIFGALGLGHSLAKDPELLASDPLLVVSCNDIVKGARYV